MVISALTQMLREVDGAPLMSWWSTCRRATGDAQLTMAQQVRLKGAVIASNVRRTCADRRAARIAMVPARQRAGARHCRNMSYYLCPQCGTRADIFGHGGARARPSRLGVPFLGRCHCT